MAKKPVPAEPAEAGFSAANADLSEIAEAEDVTESTTVIKPNASNRVATLEDVGALMMSDAEEALPFALGDVAVPFFRVLQSNSPQTKKQNAKFLEGAEAGKFMNTATLRLYDGDEGVFVIPAWFQRQATLWIPRGPEGGGTGGNGFVGEIDVLEAEKLLKHCRKNDKNKDITPAMKYGNLQKEQELELSIAALYYMLVFNKDNPTDVVDTVAFPMTSTQMKKARQWNAVIKNSRLPRADNPKMLYTPPMFGFCYKLTTVPEQNASGDWMGVKIQQDVPLIKYVDGKPTEGFEGAAQLYLAARDLMEMVKSGRAKAAAVGDEEGPTAGEGGESEEVKPPF